MVAANVGLGRLESRICLLLNLASLNLAHRCIFCSSVYKIKNNRMKPIKNKKFKMKYWKLFKC